MRLAAVVVLGACGFSTRAGALGDATGDAAPVTCGSWWDAGWAHRVLVDTTGAPADYTARIDATPVLALSRAAGDDVRAVVSANGTSTELDRVLDGNALELRVPAAGALWLYVGNAGAAAPPANPANVYTWSESFEAGNAAGFAPATPADWTVVDDGGNFIYRATGGGRHPAPIAGLTASDVEVRARIRIGPGGGQNHNGLLVRASNVVPATLDGYVGQVLEDSEYSRIAEYIDGISPPTERGTHARPVDKATWYAMRMRALGSLLEVHVDGNLDVTLTTGTPNGTTFGLFAHDTDVAYDDVRVRVLVDPEPAFALGAREDVPCE